MNEPPLLQLHSAINLLLFKKHSPTTRRNNKIVIFELKCRQIVPLDEALSYEKIKTNVEIKKLLKPKVFIFGFFFVFRSTK